MSRDQSRQPEKDIILITDEDEAEDVNEAHEEDSMMKVEKKASEEGGEATSKEPATVALMTSDGRVHRMPIERARESVILDTLLKDYEHVEDADDDGSIPLNVDYDTLILIDRVLGDVQAHRAAASEEEGGEGGGGHKRTSDREERKDDKQTLQREREEKLLQRHLDEMKLSKLYGVINAAHFLNIPFLYSACCTCLANKMDGKSVEELRDVFEIANDFDQHEEAQLRERFAWCL